mgnify:CR=1 FL=1
MDKIIVNIIDGIKIKTFVRTEIGYLADILEIKIRTIKTINKFFEE